MKPLLWTLAGLAVTGACVAAAAAPPAVVSPPAPATTASQVQFFEAKVRPLLSAKCLGCHTGASAKGKLDLGSREALLKGGEKGPSVAPGDPERSLLIQAVRYDGRLKMPLSGKLADAEIQILTEWVRMGAPWGITNSKFRMTNSANSKFENRSSNLHWAFQPVRAPKVPAVRNRWWPKTEIDRFILAGLERKGLKPNPYADRRTLIRRATFDLTGLPPTPEETDAFLADRAPDAWEKVVDRLLASPHYGERWGRHWLDVVRYSDSNGLDWNEVFPNAWRYRDYVLRSFNADKPYDQFIREQLAGDQMPGGTPEETYERLVATGMLVMGPKLLAQQDRVQLALDVADEQIDVTTKAFLGVTASCARCHDHKFDPIPTKDYYGLVGIFKSTTTLSGTLPRNNRVMYWMERPLAPAPMLEARKAHDAAVKKLQDALKKPKDDAEKARLTAELKQLQAQAPPPVPMAMAVQDGKIEEVRVHLRGSYKNLGEAAPRGFLSLAAHGEAAVPKERSGRLELAQWIARPDHPLTARVMVNRIWQGHFGRGLVATPDNFGLLGERPSHPELLDWLAGRFAGISNDEFQMTNSGAGNPGIRNSKLGIRNLKPWSLKAMHRLIMLSSVYQMSAAPAPAAYAADPENRLLWRFNRRRLEAEAVRDAMLAASGQLDRTPGGTLLTRTSGLAGKEFGVDYTSNRRSVYLPVIRGVVYDMLQVFDFPDPHVVNGRRDTTTVAPQALYMMNSPFILEQSQKFAALLLSMEGVDDARRVETAYSRALNRTPSSGEVSAALKYLDEYAGALEGPALDAEKRRAAAWQSFCQTLFAGSEFRYAP